MTTEITPEVAPESASAGGKAATPLGNETRKFGRSALVYLVPSILVRGVSFFLTPLYTRAMSPADFAIVAVSNSLVAVLGIVFGLALYSCIPRLFFEYEKTQQRKFFGTLLTVSVLVPTVAVAVLYALGMRGHLELFETVHFDPHLKLVLLSSWAGVFLPLPVSVYAAREQPGKVAVLNLLAALLQLGFSIFFVAGLHQGAVGVLRANLVSSGLTALLSIGLMFRLSTIDLRLPGLRPALAFSVPLVPHLIANWALSISDRIILDRYVPAADVGRYSLGYVFSLIIGLIAASVGNAFAPMANRQLKDPALASHVPPLGTYAMALVVVCALGVAMTAKEAIFLIAPATYESAAAVVPWVVLGAVFQGGYLIVATGTWFAMRMKLVPVITAVGAGLNVLLNVIFVPRYGLMAAAVSTAICYLVSAVLHGLLAHVNHPIPWEWARWAKLFGVAMACYFVGVGIPLRGVFLPLVVKVLVVIAVFPAVLAATGFFTPNERRYLRSLLGRRFARQR